MNDQATIGVLDEFQTDLVSAWRRVPNKGFVLVLLSAWLLLFQFLGNSTFGYVHSRSLFAWMINAYNVHDADGALTDDSVGMWVPVVVVGLLWWKRKELLELPARIWWPGLLVAGIGLGIHLIGYVIQQPRASIFALLLGIYGLIGLAWGPAWLRSCFFPFFLLVFCIPFVVVVEPLTVPLRLLATWIVEMISHWVLGIEIIRQGNLLKDPAGQYAYEVAAACSGINSLLTIGLMATIGAFVFLRSPWRRAVLIASTLPLAVAGNVLRLLTVIVSASIGGQKFGDYIHEGGPMRIISLLPYIPAFFGLIALGKRLGEQPSPVQKQP